MEFPGCVVGSELAVNACLLLSRGRVGHSKGLAYTAIDLRICGSIIVQAVCEPWDGGLAYGSQVAWGCFGASRCVSVPFGPDGTDWTGRTGRDGLDGTDGTDWMDWTGRTGRTGRDGPDGTDWIIN